MITLHGASGIRYSETDADSNAYNIREIRCVDID